MDATCENVVKFVSEAGCQLCEAIGSAKAVGGHSLVSFWKDLWGGQDVGS
jgi:hypothetical protein